MQGQPHLMVQHGNGQMGPMHLHVPPGLGIAGFELRAQEADDLLELQAEQHDGYVVQGLLATVCEVVDAIAVQGLLREQVEMVCSAQHRHHQAWIGTAVSQVLQRPRKGLGCSAMGAQPVAQLLTK